MSEEITEDDRVTAFAMDVVHERLEALLFELAGKPVAFVLCVSDGADIATSANVPLDILVSMLARAHEGAAPLLDELES